MKSKGKLGRAALGDLKSTDLSSYSGKGSADNGILNLTTINVVSVQDKLIEAFNSIGFKYDETDFSKKIDRLTAKVLNSLTSAAVDAFKSTVPVHYYSKGKISGELRKHIHATGENALSGRFKSGSKIAFSRTIYVDSDPHIVPYRKGAIPASLLAAHKDISRERRSGASLPITPFTGAKNKTSLNWVGEGQKQLASKTRLLVSKAISQAIK